MNRTDNQAFGIEKKLSKVGQQLVNKYNGKRSRIHQTGVSVRIFQISQNKTYLVDESNKWTNTNNVHLIQKHLKGLV